MKSNNAKDELINQLLHENSSLKTELEVYKERYNKLFIQYKRILKENQQYGPKTIKVEQINLQGIMEDLEVKINSPRNHYEQDLSEQQLQFQQEQMKENDGKNQQNPQINSTKESPTNEDKDSNSLQQNEFQTTFQDIRKSRKRLSISEKPHPLIDGCFIIQKQKATDKQPNLSDMVKYVYPPDLIKSQKQMLDLVVKYTFVNPELTETQDDQFNSRRNQIVYGTPYEDLTYAFEDNKWNNKKETPEIMKEMEILKKKFVHILLRPQIIELSEEQKLKRKKNTSQKSKNEQKSEKSEKEEEKNLDESMSEEEEKDEFLETQVIYGFISSFPVRNFFQDLHRTIQQQVKFNRFSTSSQIQDELTVTISNEQKYEIVGKIMAKIVNEQYSVSSFPLKYTYETGVSKVQLNIPSVETFNEMQMEFVRFSLPKYSINNISRLIHYVLSQRFIIIEGKTRKVLNQIFEIIRIIMKPFLWLFATVYIYSDYFQPFMSSPMPLIIGRLKSDSKNEKKQEDTGTEFIAIEIDEKGKDLKQKQIFYKSVKKLKKQLEKGQDKAEVIKKYVSNLKNFVVKGVLDQEPTDFHIELIETQLVSYFKDRNEK